MMSSKILLLSIFLTFALADLPDKTVNNELPSQNSLQVVDPQTGLIRWNKYTISATILAAVLVVVGIYALTSLSMPLITYKLCYLLGYCQYSLPNYIDEYLQQTQGQSRQKRSTEYLNLLTDTLVTAYEKYGEYLGPQDNKEERDKRQADYLGPLMHTLAVAYEKYQEDNPKKNSLSGTSSIK
ncbi:hypothetical protein AMK59_2482 [Oryctes borbonicus]|uniref:Uncharacterized protein n=1 Tax=Oryctes borbonicus TaxID=1629725 RepID=A0A0T6BHM8_9SCAR|nr:hypothetical protein AMK59_2482 [Oryctes borbonicus]